MSIAAISATLFVSGCGGGGSTDVVKNGSDTKTGYFIDSPVEGLSYKTSSGIEGVTDKFGRFKYKNNDKVEFKIGNLILGEAKPEDGLVTPEGFAVDNNTKILILRLLQALDSDGNVSNGITIPEDVVESLDKEINKTDISKLSEEQLTKIKALGEEIDKDYDGKIDIDANSAENHFEKSILKWKSGHKPDDNALSGGYGHGNGNVNGHGNGQG